ARDHPNLDAVVVHRPDVRSEESESAARDLLVKPLDLTSDDLGRDLSVQTKSIHAAITSAMDWDKWVPPGNKSIEQLGGQVYWHHFVRTGQCPDLDDPTVSGSLWQCTLLGPPVSQFGNTGFRLFDMLAARSTKLIFPQYGTNGSALLSRWLI